MSTFENVKLYDGVSPSPTRLSDHPNDHVVGLSPSALTFVLADNSVDAVARILHLLAVGRPLALLDSQIADEHLAQLIARYAPEQVLHPGGSDSPTCLSEPDFEAVGPGVWRSNPSPLPLHPDLALLLPTSGTTGSPKMVRLSRANVAENASGIVESLGISPDDRAVTSLPVHYSFGLSVLTSHAIAGASIVVSAASIIEPAFWDVVNAQSVTSLAGVPTTYAMLRRLRFESMDTPSIHTLTQAGGRLDPDAVAHFSDYMRTRGGRFFVMYGQTEAAPRMSVLPPSSLPMKLGSVGCPLPGGRFTVVDPSGAPLPSYERGEVIYSGPNVMMGYAGSRQDLAAPDLLNGELSTGDLGYLDDEGFLFITGRSKRIAKVAGNRIGLDEVEAMLHDLEQVAALDAGDQGIVIVTTSDQEVEATLARKRVCRALRIPQKLLTVRTVEAFPRLASGKTDYSALKAWMLDGGEPDGT